MVLALLVAAALLAPVVALIGSLDAQQPPPTGTVWPPGVAADRTDATTAGLYDYFWDSATRAYTPVNDFVRVALGDTVDWHMRANDIASFLVCPSVDNDADPPVALTLQACRDRALHVRAGGTCGAAVAYANGVGDRVRGHQHVITLCGGVYTLGGLNMLTGEGYASVAAKQGAIVEGSTEGTTSSGVVEITGAALGVAQAEYCMTSYPNPCRRRALIDIVVEPANWTDARVVGVNDEYRLELDWSQQVAYLKTRPSGSAIRWKDATRVDTYCCLSNLDYWSFDLRLPVMLGSETVTTGRDEVVFYNSGGSEVGRTRCLPLYCDQIIPMSPTVARWVVGAADSVGVDVDAAGKGLHVTLWGNPTDAAGVRPKSGSVVAPVITYCLAHWQQSCDASTCARATYRNAPNLNLQSWMNVVPSSAYVATTNCPALAEVRVEVADVTPAAYDLANVRFVAPTPVNTPVAPPAGAPLWIYRPDPVIFDINAPAPNSPLWCFPGRFVGSAIGDLAGDAERWIDDPATTEVSAARVTRFLRYFDGLDADGNDVAAWPSLPARDIDSNGQVRHRDVLILQIVEREYEALVLNPGAFPDRDPTLGAMWAAAAQEVFESFVDPISYETYHDDLYATANPAEDPADYPDPPAAPATLVDFVGDYLDSLGTRHDVDLASRSLAQRDGKVFDAYDRVFAYDNEWNSGPLWWGLVRSAYQGTIGDDGAPLLLVDHRLAEDPGAQTRSCLARGTTLEIVGAWGTYPGAVNWGDPTYGLCGIGFTSAGLPAPTDPPVGPLAWRRRDADCPADALVPGGATLPQLWLRDDLFTEAYDPRLGPAWESASADATACRDASVCDIWAPPIAGYYQVRVRITRSEPANPYRNSCDPVPFSGDPAPSPECAYHLYLDDRVSVARGNLPPGWSDYWGPSVRPPPNDDHPFIEFDDLVWVSGVRVDAIR